LQRRWLFSFGKSEQSKGRKHQPPRGRNMQKKKEENKRQPKATKPCFAMGQLASSIC
jgi:hypothetical protein